MGNAATLQAICAGAALSALVATAAVAATLDVKPGLWEVTSQGETTGTPPIPPQALAQMSPQQRAQVMAAMAAAMGNQPLTLRSCITAKMLQRGWNPNEDRRENCTQTDLGSTSRSMNAHMECTGEHHITGTLHIAAADRQTMHGTVNIIIADGTNTMTVKRTLDGKWLGGDCGNVKPQGE